MITLTILLLVTFTVSVTARWLGASRRKTVGAGLLPVITLLVYLGSTTGLELGPHGGIIPAWMTIIAGLGAALVPASLAAWIVPQKEPIQPPEPMRAKGPHGSS